MSDVASLRLSRDSLGQKAADVLRRQILTGELPAGTRLVEDELERRIDVLITQKELSPVDGKRLLLKLLQAGSGEGEPTFIEAAIRRYLEEQEIPSRGDFLKLQVQVEELVEELDEYETA